MLTASEKITKCLLSSGFLHKDGVFVVACSGGADSLALTDGLCTLQHQVGYKLGVCHIQHHLRGQEAETDALAVEHYCVDRGLSFCRLDVDVKAAMREGGLSTEEAARSLRYCALETYRQQLEAELIFLAHHRDDQAETVLLNLLRGTGTKGVRGMLPRNGFLARPFLSLSRQDMEDYCRERHLCYCLDSSNDNLEYKRNWVRKELLPLLAGVNPQIKKSLAQTALFAAEDEACLEELACQYLDKYGDLCAGGYRLNLQEYSSLPRALQKRVLFLFSARNAFRLTSVHVQALIELIGKGVSGKSIALPEVTAVYTHGYLMIIPAVLHCSGRRKG